MTTATVKTYKREISIIMLVALGYLVFGVGDVQMVQAIVEPIFYFAALSFGLDWVGKSSIVQSLTSRNGAGTGGEGEYPANSGKATDNQS